MLAKSTVTSSWNNHNHENWKTLWTEIQDGKCESLSRLFCAAYSQLFSYGYTITHDEALIKDCIQELFLNIWRMGNTIADAKSVKAYLISSLRRIIFRRLQKQRNRAKRNYEYSEDFFSDIGTVEEVIIQFETETQKKQKLVEALLKLSDRQKEAVSLKFYSGLSNDEISEVMNVNKQSVYNHISKAIQKMQHFLQADAAA